MGLWDFAGRIFILRHIWVFCEPNTHIWAKGSFLGQNRHIWGANLIWKDETTSIATHE